MLWKKQENIFELPQVNKFFFLSQIYIEYTWSLARINFSLGEINIG
jgi:hypothetical protein